MPTGPSEPIYCAGEPVLSLTTPQSNIISQLSAFSYDGLMRFSMVVYDELWYFDEYLSWPCTQATHTHREWLWPNIPYRQKIRCMMDCNILTKVCLCLVHKPLITHREWLWQNIPLIGVRSSCETTVRKSGLWYFDEYLSWPCTQATHTHRECNFDELADFHMGWFYV